MCWDAVSIPTSILHSSVLFLRAYQNMHVIHAGIFLSLFCHLACDSLYQNSSKELQIFSNSSVLLWSCYMFYMLTCHNTPDSNNIIMLLQNLWKELAGWFRCAGAERSIAGVWYHMTPFNSNLGTNLQQSISKSLSGSKKALRHASFVGSKEWRWHLFTHLCLTT